jgi:eukaryotic-like serine/threonine-protein kinase
MDVHPGQQVGAKFVLVRQIGTGGMATVWVAEDRELGRRVAVKVLDAEHASNAKVVERFTSEARAMARIRSPFVPEIYERGALADGTPYTVMELLDGEDLDGRLRARGPLSVRGTARLVAQVAAALTEAHGLGIVHRDVKAENILVSGSGDRLRARLIDFGIAKIPGADGRHATQTATMGTPAYMSPEQLASTKDVDARADVWSLGVVAYMALTGRTPFEGETFLAVCLSIREGVFPPPCGLVPELPGELDAWMAKALAPDAAKRFQSARALSEALTAIAQRVPAPARANRTTDADERHTVDAVSKTRSTVRAPRRWVGAGLVVACAAAAGLWTTVPQVRSWVLAHPVGALRDARVLAGTPPLAGSLESAVSRPAPPPVAAAPAVVTLAPTAPPVATSLAIVLIPPPAPETPPPAASSSAPAPPPAARAFFPRRPVAVHVEPAAVHAGDLLSVGAHEGAPEWGASSSPAAASSSGPPVAPPAAGDRDAGAPATIATSSLPEAD